MLVLMFCTLCHEIGCSYFRDVFLDCLIQKITTKVHMCPKVSGYEAVGIFRINVADRIGEIYMLLILLHVT